MREESQFGPDAPAVAGGEGPAEGLRLPEAVLRQSEIDALTGYEEVGFTRGSALQTVADAAGRSSEAMPILEVALARTAKLATIAFRDRLSPGASVQLRGVGSLRYGEYLDGLALPLQLFGFRAEGWGGGGFVAVAPDCAALLLDTLLGGSGSFRTGPSARPPTAIETQILAEIVARLLGEAERSLSASAPVAFALSGFERNPRETELVGLAETTLVASFELDIGGRTGAIDLVLPASTLEPVRTRLAEPYTGEGSGGDDIWARHLATEVWQAGIEAEAVLPEMRVPLGRVLDLAVGETLMLDCGPADMVALRCGGILLAHGRIGRVDGRIAVQVAEPLRPSHAAAGSAGLLP